MNDDDKFNFFCCAVVGIVFSAITFFATRGSWEREAVNLGHAEYYLDAEHQRQWRWRTNLNEWVHVEQATNGNFVVTFPQSSDQSVTINKP
jgi:hypothetical protein